MADLAIEGAICEGCGEEMGDAPGYPQLCEECEGSPDISDDELMEGFDERLTPAQIMDAIRELEPRNAEALVPMLAAWLAQRSNP